MSRHVTFSFLAGDAVDRRIVAREMAERLRGFLSSKTQISEGINEDLEGWVLDVGHGTHVIVAWEDEYSVAVAPSRVGGNMTTVLPIAQLEDRLADEIDRFLKSDSRISSVRWQD